MGLGFMLVTSNGLPHSCASCAAPIGSGAAPIGSGDQDRRDKLLFEDSTKIEAMSVVDTIREYVSRFLTMLSDLFY